MTPERYRRINDLFEAASERSSVDRDAFLRQACAGDDALRREVDALLSSDSHSGGVLENAPSDLAAGVVGASLTRTLPQAALTGRVLGPYQLIELLGMGGMGEVYRARDIRLGRDVAIKTLTRGLEQDPEQIKRLRREAEILAALNHPSIAAVYDVGESDGTAFIVLEMIPGKTLTQLLERGPLPMPDGLSLCGKIAEALEAAHERGIIHRDLKPGNVMITPGGQVKVLDFGLAKSHSSDPDETTAIALTREGIVMGTVTYMSPEQARGLRLDKRSDIWSFGCVLYETLTGKRVFEGQKISDIIAAILRDEPKLDNLPEATPVGIRLLIARCLERDPKRRLRDIGDARIEIDDALSDNARALLPSKPRIPAGPRRWRSILAGVVIASGTAAGFLGWSLRGRSVNSGPMRNVQVQRITDMVGLEETPAISPDGKTVAFVARVTGRRQIWLRLLAGGAPLQITRDDADHDDPRWAPDSSSLIYFAETSTPGQGAIWETSALGGAARRIASATGAGDISHDGHRIAAFQRHGQGLELVTITRDGSGVQILKQFSQGMQPHDHPRWSPDDRWIAFRRGMTGIFDEEIYVIHSDGGEPRRLAGSEGLKGLAWLPDGSGLVYASSAGSTILYPPTYNLRTIRLDGSGEHQLTFGEVSYVEPDVHSSGKLVASRIRSQSDIWKFPTAGTAAGNTRSPSRITAQTGQARTPSVSPDGKELVYLSDSGGHGNLWVAKTDGSGVRQITFERDPAVVLGVPVWSTAGNQIVFIRIQSEHTGEWMVNSDGSGAHEFLPSATCAYWSADGRWFYFQPANFLRIDKIPAAGGPPVVVRSDGDCPAGVPDDRTLFFVRTQGVDDVEIRRASPQDGPSQLLSRIPSSRVPVAAPFLQPILSPDGKWMGTPLLDAGTTNLFLLPAAGGPLRAVTDFGSRSVLIARRISWSPDSKFIYAAVADIDADIVLFDGILRPNN